MFQPHQAMSQPLQSFQQQPISTQKMMQNATLFQGQLQNFTPSMSMADNSSGIVVSNGTPAAFSLLDGQNSTALASLSPEQQQQLFVAFSQGLNNNGTIYYPTDQSFQSGRLDGMGVQGGIQSQDGSAIDFSTIAFNNNQQQLFASAASSSTAVPTMISDDFLNPGGDVQTTITSRSMPSVTSNMSRQGTQSASPSPLVQSQPLQHQRQQTPQQEHQFGGNGRLSSPDTASSPGGSVSEESILRSWSVNTFHDQIYLNPNLARDDPRNDLGTFVYLPSEFEYGDAPALSPAASSVTGGSGGAGGSEAGGSPPHL
ncbi:hypothetical protein B0O80DRAFT_466441 [Mortierella sp. GBAus27b]|nr:hypothetical protein B0O80DRAFT_466441 [Mortierella sp. GBAus27b]